MKNIIKQALNPSRFYVMLKKVMKRFIDSKGSITKEENLKWLKNNCSSVEEFFLNLDKDLWYSTLETSKKIQKNAENILDNLEYDLGGGGFYPLLYFIIKFSKPKVVIETGVAAGFSSYAILKAMHENNRGILYSSDFPYFRLPKPEQFIGIVIEESLKDRWELYIEGDEVNLPKIISKVESIDLFHYDSDKSYSGRKYAMNLLKQKIHKKGIIVMDDIQDNSYFYDYVTKGNNLNWKIFKFEGKFIGVIGDFYNSN